MCTNVRALNCVCMIVWMFVCVCVCVCLCRENKVMCVQGCKSVRVCANVCECVRMCVKMGVYAFVKYCLSMYVSTYVFLK